MSSGSYHIQTYHSKLEVNKRRGPLTEIRFRILSLGFVSALMIKANPLQTESGLKNNRLIRPPGALPEESLYPSAVVAENV